jgi:HSP20 family protein
MLTDLVPSGFRALAPWRRRDELVDFQRSVNKLMRDFFEDEPAFLSQIDAADVGATFAPRMELQEYDDKIVLSAELPGLSDKDVEVSIDKEALTVRGEKKEEKETKGVGRSFSERRYGVFERTIRLPASVDKDKISAKFEHGVLTVEVPKTPEARREVKKIPIKH